MNVLNEIAAGGQTWAHRVRMIRQVLKIVVIAAITLSILLFIYLSVKKTTFYQWQAVWYSFKACCLKLFQKNCDVDPNFWRHARGVGSSYQVSPMQVLQVCERPISSLALILKASIKASGYAFTSLICAFLLFFLIRGKKSKRKEHLSGIGILSDLSLKAKLRVGSRASDLKMGSVPLLKNSETKHMLICGTTGSGKTNCLNQLLLQIRERGERAVIVDTTGSFVSYFFREKEDILINPYDKRSVRWHPWCECKKDYHFEQLVNSLIPSMQYFDNFFPEAGRAVLYSSLRKAAVHGETNIEEFVSSMLRKSIGELYEDLRDTDASVYVDPKGDKTTVSVRATIANSIRHFRPLKKTTNPFSIRDWILSSEKKDQWAFISCTTEQRRSIKSLMSVWFSIAINAMKAKSVIEKPEKIWFIIDELHSLQKLEYLEESLAELRKYGGCIVLATQDVSQMDRLYGSHSTKTIINLCGTKVCFRQEDADIAQRMARFFGEREFKEVQEGISYGAHEMRDGVNLSKTEKIKPTVSPTKILELNDLEAYIKLPGGIPAAKTIFKYQSMDPLTQSFLN